MYKTIKDKQKEIEEQKEKLKCDCGHIERELYRIYEGTSKGKICTICFLKLLGKEKM